MELSNYSTIRTPITMNEASHGLDRAPIGLETLSQGLLDEY